MCTIPSYDVGKNMKIKYENWLFFRPSKGVGLFQNARKKKNRFKPPKLPVNIYILTSYQTHEKIFFLNSRFGHFYARIFPSLKCSH